MRGSFASGRAPHPRAAGAARSRTPTHPSPALTRTRPRTARAPHRPRAHALSPTPACTLSRVSSVPERPPGCAPGPGAAAPAPLRPLSQFVFFYFLNFLFLSSQVALCGSKLWHRWPPQCRALGGSGRRLASPERAEGCELLAWLGVGLCLAKGTPTGWTPTLRCSPASPRASFPF